MSIFLGLWNISGIFHKIFFKRNIPLKKYGNSIQDFTLLI
jgi:hypothetical protein